MGKYSPRPAHVKDTTIIDQIRSREILPEPKYEDGQQRPMSQMEFYNDRAIAHMIELEWLYRELITNARACIPSESKMLWLAAAKLLIHASELSTAAAVRLRLKQQGETPQSLPAPDQGPRPVAELSDAELARLAGRNGDGTHLGDPVRADLRGATAGNRDVGGGG